ncbi:glutamate receptor ionotropic, kainate 3-like [Trichogramma pretiosum]|uniref:glutamate receptor ionotropic, kainate 3-like n=1 Tax=Trichogramma pretiosum TaxID=7493 RepID=UPI0006C9D6EA|nr:glutamate receptor ionotropic, kainate 3-like [Trichogramma pretiosum]
MSIECSLKSAAAWRLLPLLLLLLLISVQVHPSTSYVELPKTVIGGLFDRNGSSMRRSFSLAVRSMNSCLFDRHWCDRIQKCEPRHQDCDQFHFLQISALVLEVDGGVIDAHRKFGELAGHGARDPVVNDYGLAAVFGPHSELSSRYVQGLCELHDLPNIVVRREIEHDPVRSINLYPDLGTLAHVYVEMVKKLNWTSFVVLYERPDNFAAVEKLLKMYGPYDYPVYPFALGGGSNYSLPLLRAKATNCKSIVIDCSYERLAAILAQTQQVGMMTDSYRYFVTSLDLQTLDLGPYRHSGANISGIRLLDPDDPFVRDFVRAHLDELEIAGPEQLRTEDALVFDAVAMFAQAYKHLAYDYEPAELRGNKLPQNYDEPVEWPLGLSLRNYLLYNTINGLTGPVMLDTDGSRRRFELDVLNLQKTGLKKIGKWNPDDGFDELHIWNELKMKHFNILITITPPYAMRVNYSKSLEGNERYEGFVVDIIKELSRIIGFNYTFHVQEDAQNGACNKSQSGVCRCTGMMERIISGEMDMAITDLTITEERELCVDFSTAFWNLGMSILYKKPAQAPATLFSFLSTFDTWVWIYLALAYVLMSLMFFALGRISPAEWTNPHPCVEEPSELHNQFTINNSFWFTSGALMQQGSEIAPIAISTRAMAGFWFFFCLIIISTYTANLTAFLTVESPVRVVRGIEDLYNQSKIKFGAKRGGSTFMYFQSSRNPKHRQLAEIMQSKQWERYMPSSNAEGIKLAQTENYAFIMESSSIEYIQYRMCDLEQAGPLIDQKSYAIAYKENFEYHQQISRTISVLQEKLVIKGLYNKWWKEKGAVCFKSKSTTADPMNWDQLMGVFLVLAVGSFLTLGITLWEFFCGVRKVTKKSVATFKQTVTAEIKNVSGSKAIKPVLNRKPSNESSLTNDFNSINYTP